MNRLFNLPNNILSDIYTMDTTYRDILKQIHFEIWKRSFIQFKHDFTNHQFFDNKPILQGKLIFMFDYLFQDTAWLEYNNLYDRNGEYSSFSLPMSSDIVITATWNNQIHNFIYRNYKLFVSSFDDNIDDIDPPFKLNKDDFYWEDDEHKLPLLVDITIPYHHRFNMNIYNHRFKTYIYSNEHYQSNLKDDERWNYEDFHKFTTQGSRLTNIYDLFKCANEKFSIVQNLYV